MARIYLTGSGQTKGYTTGSGIISNPVRILLLERDIHTGSYPTIARTGDSDFTGIYSSIFDDTNTINFVSQQVIYPTNLPAASKFVSGGIATPNILQGISGSGKTTAGVADTNIIFTPGQNISPFNDSRVYIETNSTFYSTGTSASILPGFDQRLSSKTIVQLDINPNVSTNVFFSTGTVAHAAPYASSEAGLAAGINSGLAYFDWSKKQWQIIGNLTTGSNVDFLNPSPTVRSSAIHLAVGQQVYAIGSPRNVIARHVGRFHSTYGFPFATQYNSTGSQELHLTGVLSGPFLLEKAVLEWSGSFPSTAGATDDGPLCYQFFLMNVAPVSDTVSIVQDVSGTASGNGPFTTRSANFSVTQVKDLIWSGEISRTDPLYTTSPYQRDLTISNTTSAITGTFRVGAPASIYNRNDGLVAHSLRIMEGATPTLPLVSNKIGFRNFGGFVEGKSFIRPIAAITPSGTVTANGVGSSPAQYTVSAIQDLKTTSPYILLPNHKLVLGFYGAPLQGTWTDYDSVYSERYASTHVTTLSPGAGRLTLYGSLLRGGKPVEPETNQPLTSNAIHEDLHYDNPVYDQFDVEPFECLSGSYVDLVITGSMFATPLADPFAVNVRKVQASTAAGQAGLSGSLQRFVSLVSSNDALYDSYPANLSEIYSRIGVGAVDVLGDGVNVGLAFTSPGNSAAAGKSWLDRSWYFRNAYEISSTRFINKSFSGVAFPAYKLSNNASMGVEQLTAGQTAIVYDVNGNIASVVDDQQNETSVEAFKNAYKFIWGFGDAPYNMPSFAGVNSTSLVKPVIRGYKYGLAGIFGSFAGTKFRRDRYGQFRDMLEQSPNTAYLVGRNVEYPVQISFYSRPSKDGAGSETTDSSLTHSQNLSVFSTSSLPYYDGVAVDRTDNPDVSLRELPAIPIALFRS